MPSVCNCSSSEFIVCHWLKQLLIYHVSHFLWIGLNGLVSKNPFSPLLPLLVRTNTAVCRSVNSLTHTHARTNTEGALWNCFIYEMDGLRVTGVLTRLPGPSKYMVTHKQIPVECWCFVWKEWHQHSACLGKYKHFCCLAMGCFGFHFLKEHLFYLVLVCDNVS